MTPGRLSGSESTCCEILWRHLVKFTWKVYEVHFLYLEFLELRSQGLYSHFQVQTFLEVICLLILEAPCWNKSCNLRIREFHSNTGNDFFFFFLLENRILTSVTTASKLTDGAFLSYPCSTLGFPWCPPFVLGLCSSLHRFAISEVNCSPFFLLFSWFAHSTFFSPLTLSKLFHHLIFAFFEPITPSLHHFIFVLVQLQKWDLAVTNLLAKPPRAPRGCASSRRTCVIDWTWGKLCQAGHHYWISWLIINSPLPQVLRGDTSVMWRIFMTHGALDCYAWCSLPDSFLCYVWAPSSLAKCPWPQHICYALYAWAGLDVREKSANVSLSMSFGKYGY